jgi:hypothetical protein
MNRYKLTRGEKKAFRIEHNRRARRLAKALIRMAKFDLVPLKVAKTGGWATR